MPDASACEAVLVRFERGELSAPVALMQLLIATEDAAHVEEIVHARAAGSQRATEILALMARNTRGCERVAAMLRSDVDSPPLGASVAEGVAFCRQLFDWSVQQCEEASVALYSLGNPELLALGTTEIVELLESWGSLGPDKRALDIGCGIGRLESALSPRLKEIHGIDVSENMVAVARRRCDGLSNATFATCSGLDLAGIEDARYDLVLAVDSFPYLVQSGIALVAMHFREMARVLAATGEVAILNFSYREDAAQDRSEVAGLAQAHGFHVRTNGTSPLSFWDATVFHLTRVPPV
ncbi:MAG: methyltransferase domain-containing protein [Myxococcota bacterium]|nr:methyltransferase domain-containing protein [Myxococcota bacterium]